MSIHYANSIRLITSTTNHVTTIPIIANSMLSALRWIFKQSESGSVVELLASFELVLLPGIV
jgi:hypothetical protein